MEDVMSNQDVGGQGFGSQEFGSQDSSGNMSRGGSKTFKQTASQAFTKAADMAREGGTKAKQAASDTASTMNEQVREMLDKQIGNSWSFAGQVASSFKLAADDLDQKSPMAASLVRGFADKVEGYAEEFQDQTVEQLMRSASDFTRRQPALVFGLAALAAFFMFRTVKTQVSTDSPPTAPEHMTEPDRHNG
jgi:hypothetical protein